MRRDGDADIAARRMDEGCRLLWRAVVEQALRDARRPLPSGLVAGADMENAVRKAADILDARAFRMQSQQSEDMHNVLDLASMTGITPAAHARGQAAIDADAADPSRAGWYMTGGGYVLFRRPAGNRKTDKAAAFAA